MRHLQAKPKPTVSHFQMQDADYTAPLASSPAAIQHNDVQTVFLQLLLSQN